MVAALAAPLARAGTPVQGELELEDAQAEGDVSFAARVGSLHLRDPAAALLRWERAEGYVLTETREQVGPMGAFAGEPRFDNRSVAFGRGALRDVRCGGGCTFLLMADGSGGTLRATAAGGPFAWLARDAVTGNFDEPARDRFHHKAAAGWLDVAAGDAAAEGAVAVYLRNVTATVVDERGEHELSAANESRAGAAPGGVAVTRSVLVRFAVLHVEGLAMEARAPATLRAPHPDVRVDGAIVAARATGWLRVGGETHRLDGEPLRLAGALQAALVAEPGLPAPVASDDRLRASVEGEAESVWIGAARVAEAPRVSPASVAVGLTVAALLALLVAKLAGMVPFYTRLERQDLLLNPNRRAIYERLRATPGLRLADLARDLDMSKVVVRHHLRMLIAHAHVVAKGEGRVQGFLPADVAQRPFVAEAAMALADPTRRAIADALARSERPLSQKEVAQLAGTSLRLASYHLGRLEQARLVEVSGFMPRGYRATGPLRAALDARREPAPA